MNKIYVITTIIIFLWSTTISVQDVEVKESPLVIDLKISVIAIQNAGISPEQIDNVKVYEFDKDAFVDGRTTVIIEREGVPATLLTYVRRGSKPILTPYPSWNENANIIKSVCSGITLSRICVTCNQLFVLDSGWIGIEQICPAKLLIFDLKTNRLDSSVLIPPSLFNERPQFLNMIVDAENVYFVNNETCMNVNAFNHRINTWCKQTDCNFRITNQNVDLNDGVIGQSLSTDYIYFTLLTDNNRYEMFKMSLNPLKDCTASMENQSASPVKFLSMGQINLSKAAIEIDSNENMFFFMETDEIWCWNTKRSFTKENFHLFAELTFKNADRLQIIRNQQDKEELCAWSTEPQNFEIRNKRMEIKIGFAKFQIDQLINGGICGI